MLITHMSNQPQPSQHKKGSLPTSALAALVMSSILVSLNTAYAQSESSIKPIAQQAVSATLTQTVGLQNSLVKTDAPETDAFTDTLIKTVTQKKLATHPTWLRLHYYTDTANGDYQSKVDNPSFFVSPNGVNNPQDELEAFITKLVSQNRAGDIDGKDNVACRFPARTQWLLTQLKVNDIKPNCPDFEAWMQALDAQQLSVVFAEPYPDQAVSAFGHTLMLIDSQASLANPAAIDKAHALNVTVGGDAKDPFVVFTAKSITGGYPNQITIDPYPDKLSDYLQKDNRDVWTYALNLSPAEVQQIMRHVWESKDLNLPYYFTLDNCASEILRYIDLVRPEGHLLAAFNVAIVPADVVQLLDKQGLITKKSYFPADKTLAQAQRNDLKLAGLSNSSILSATKQSNAQFEANTRLEPTNALKPLTSPKLTDKPLKTEDNRQLLLTPLIPADNNVLDAHARQQWRLGIGNETDNGYLSLAYRGGFHDPLDKPSGYPQNFHLEVGSLALRVYEDDNNNPDNNNNNTSPSSRNHPKHDRFELQDLTLIRGRSLHPINSARAGESLLSSWGISVQAMQVMDASQVTNTSHLVGNIAFEKGTAMAFGTAKRGTGEVAPHLCYGFGTGLAQVGKGLNHGYRVGAGVNVGCRYLLNQRARVVGELQLPYWYHGDIHQTAPTNHGINDGKNDRQSSYWQPTLSLGAQYDINKNQAIRLKSSYQFQDRVHNNTDIQLSYVQYF